MLLLLRQVHRMPLGLGCQDKFLFFTDLKNKNSGKGKPQHSARLYWEQKDHKKKKKDQGHESLGHWVVLCLERDEFLYSSDLTCWGYWQSRQRESGSSHKKLPSVWKGEWDCQIFVLEKEHKQEVSCLKCLSEKDINIPSSFSPLSVCLPGISSSLTYKKEAIVFHSPFSSASQMWLRSVHRLVLCCLLGSWWQQM